MALLRFLKSCLRRHLRCKKNVNYVTEIAYFELTTAKPITEKD